MSSETYQAVWLSGHQSTQFFTRTYPASSPKAALVFIHGYIEHCGRYTDIHSKLAAHGITVFTFDLRGFGNTALNDEHKSKTSSYGKTSWVDQMADIQWAIDHVKKEVPGVPVFLMGQSMGGGQVLGFATEGKGWESLAGVIAQSPCIELTKPASKIARFLGKKVGLFLPYMTIPADVKPATLSRDPAVGEAFLKDPLVKHFGTLRGVDDMLSKGEDLLQTRYHKWPKTLPLLLIHGSGDLLTSHKASQQFHDKVVSDNKKILIYEGAYHELNNEPDGLPAKLVEDIVAFIGTCASTSSAEIAPVRTNL
ncbi:Alpha/Beta hydrolase protein [Mycena floridula]|nr:Alpha/Beta hydrolase protein [Mycena floridula]